MFDRFIRFAQARRALRAGHFEEVIRLLEDPLVAGERRARQLRQKALAGMLGRARRRAGASNLNLEAALADVERVLEREPELAGAQTLRAGLEARARARQDEGQAAREMRAEARKLVDQGELQAALNLCQQAAEIQPAPAEQAVIEKLVEGRRSSARESLAQAGQALSAGDLQAARQLLTRARSSTPELAGLEGVTDKLVRKVAREQATRLKGLHPGPDADALLDRIASEQLSLPGLLEDRALHSAIERIANEKGEQILEELGDGRLEAAVGLYRQAQTLLRDRGQMAKLGEGLRELGCGLEARKAGDLQRSLGHLQSALRSLPLRAAKPLEELLSRLRAEQAQAESSLGLAREEASGGNLMEAREKLMQILEKWPGHESVRKEMEILNQQARDREERLAKARALAEEGRLKTASALLLDLAAGGEQGREARLLLKDIQARMDLVGKGIAQVRRAVHGQSSASQEGLAHCVARLCELQKAQTDDEEIDSLLAALAGEIEGLEQLGALRAALERRSTADAGEALAGFLAGRKRMLHPDRLDSRFLEVADLLLRRAEAAMQATRLQEASGWLVVLGVAESCHETIRARLARLRRRLEEQQALAQKLLDRLRAAVDGGEVAKAETCLGELRNLWIDHPTVARMESQILGMRAQEEEVGEVERLTRTEDLAGARRRLSEMPPTPQFLRTRIFDIKQGLAKAQGLDHGFLLRVDEGGEFLVLRKDSLSIGNVRGAKADVQLLANIAGRHARIRRSMSFHGGMQDEVLSEEGEVFLNGNKVQCAKLRSGDRLRLGNALELTYSLPSKRSLTAALIVGRGFQVAGTDKILLLKDRGRDGRILLGPAKDAHVRLPHDEEEVEIYSSPDGQVRVRYAGKGEMDGRPFSGEHPVTAGALVRCGTIAFVLQPWTPDS